MKQYLTLLKTVREDGVRKADRTGTGTLSVFGHQLRCDLGVGFPVLTTKKLHLRSIIYELLWFLRGETNIKYLTDHDVTIWDEWADEAGELGPIYGAQWRTWPTAAGASTAAARAARSGGGGPETGQEGTRDEDGGCKHSRDCGDLQPASRPQPTCICVV